MRQSKFRIIWRFLRGVAPLFLLSFFCSMLNTIFTSLTPQIIRFAVDSIIGTEPAAGLPEPLLRAL
ncbi:MAG: hypothetical protein PUC36_08090, partial [Clostridiales bacterium]|nr:hypothetical protein [Clostridiales bacterium]